jgi:hypothetical protein
MNKQCGCPFKTLKINPDFLYTSFFYRRQRNFHENPGKKPSMSIKTGNATEMNKQLTYAKAGKTAERTIITTIFFASVPLLSDSPLAVFYCSRPKSFSH